MTADGKAMELIARAAALWNEPDQAERLLLEAHRCAPRSADALVGLYRFYFYRSELAKALAVAEACIADAAVEIGVSPDWRRVAAGGRDFADLDSPLHRFYLFALKAYGYLLLRLGRCGEGEALLAKVRELDPLDRVGSGVLQQVMSRQGRVDPDD